MEIAATMSALARPMLARKATTASGLDGDLRWARNLEDMRACAGVSR
jgi:hypothetical protein